MVRFIIFAWLVMPTMLGQVQAGSRQPMVVAEHIAEYRLANGATVILVPGASTGTLHLYEATRQRVQALRSPATAEVANRVLREHTGRHVPRDIRHHPQPEQMRRAIDRPCSGERRQVVFDEQSVHDVLTGQLNEDVTLDSRGARNDAFAVLTLSQVNAALRCAIDAAGMVEVLGSAVPETI